MLSLIVKDLRAGALYLGLKVLVLGLLLASALVSGKAFLVLSCVLAAAAVAVVALLDWSVGADRFVHSLPVSRAGVVRARYATSLLLASACLILASAMAVIFAAIVAGRGGVWPPWVMGETALAALLYVGVFVAVLLGCLFQFGVGAGGVAAVIVMAVLAPVGVRLVRPAVLADLMREVGVIPVVTAAIVAAGLLNWVSMRISVRAHASREF